MGPGIRKAGQSHQATGAGRSDYPGDMRSTKIICDAGEFPEGYSAEERPSKDRSRKETGRSGKAGKDIKPEDSSVRWQSEGGRDMFWITCSVLLIPVVIVMGLAEHYKQ